MYKNKFERLLGLHLNNSTELEYDNYGKVLTSGKASSLTRGDDNCITENTTPPNWMSSTW
ncbi:hypothetical protein Aasi_0899 [Candidatus Amoebophilus asiaticus 5a2]|uniref:Uncharacterized protein n=1 Tax=Amoebophilus asiaticus (strain 5a2) TaxID=452471 RepID=B3ESR4_AMOA5|nr:hypothetical protein Aasi_0899 [Candidatus Amoebophilus asiaticus 5a2]